MLKRLKASTIGSIVKRSLIRNTFRYTDIRVDERIVAYLVGWCKSNLCQHRTQGIN